MKYINVPGLNNSGPDHWQTIWEEQAPEYFERVRQRDWQKPDCHEWVESLDNLIQRQTSPFIIVAHSLGCLTVVHWAVNHHSALLKAALLVAPADADRSISPLLSAFAPIPKTPLAFPTVLVASTNDPYASLSKSVQLAASWQSHLVCTGAQGHINASSSLGDWAVGKKLLLRLQQQVEPPKGNPARGFLMANEQRAHSSVI